VTLAQAEEDAGGKTKKKWGKLRRGRVLEHLYGRLFSFARSQSSVPCISFVAPRTLGKTAYSHGATLADDARRAFAVHLDVIPRGTRQAPLSAAPFA
jgi:hypothetical protein